MAQDYEWLEFFAGQGNLTRLMMAAQYKSARFDVLDHEQPSNRRSNFMDLTHSSGFGLFGFKENVDVAKRVAWVLRESAYMHTTQLHIESPGWRCYTYYEVAPMTSPPILESNAVPLAK